MKATRKQQLGASFSSILFVLIVLGTAFSVGFKLYPAYMDNKIIDSVLTDVINDPLELKKSIRVLRLDIGKKLRINQTKMPNKDELKIVNDKGTIKMDLKYEVRVPMFFNVDAMVKFEKQYKAVAP